MVRNLRLKLCAFKDKGNAFDFKICVVVTGQILELPLSLVQAMISSEN